MDLWEAVHSTFNLRARYLLHVVEGAGQELSSLFKSIEDCVILALIQLDTFVRLAAQVRWVNHQVNRDLTDSVCA